MIGHRAKGLAFAFLAGPWNEAELLARGEAALGPGSPGPARWLRGLVKRVLVAFPAAPIDREDDLALVLEDDRHFRRAAGRTAAGLPAIRRWRIPDQAMVSVDGPPSAFRVAEIASPADLAAALGLTHAELAWFADPQRMNAGASDAKLAHYHHRWVAKARGARSSRRTSAGPAAGRAGGRVRRDDDSLRGRPGVFPATGRSGAAFGSSSRTWVRSRRKRGLP